MKKFVILFLLSSCQLTEVGFVAPYQDKRFFDVTTVGIIPNTGLNLSNDIQNLIDTTTATTLYFPAGTYLLDTTLVFRKVVNVLGEGYQTTFKTTGNYGAFHIDGGSWATRLDGVIISNIRIKNTTTSETTTNWGIRIKYTNLTKIENVTVTGFLTNIGFNECVNYSIRSCYINGFTQYGLKFVNYDPLIVDSGDGFVSDCTIGSSLASTASIYQTNSGGLKINNCKFNGGGGSNGPLYHYRYLGVNKTVDALISNSSFENFTKHAILIDKGTSSFKDVVIDGNQFAYGIGSNPTIQITGVEGISVTDNVMRGNGNNYAVSLTDCTNGKVDNVYSNYISLKPIILTNCMNIKTP